MAAITIGPLEEGSWVHPGIRYGVDDVAIGYIMLYLVYYLVYHLYIICIYYLVIYVIQMVGLYLQFCWLQIKNMVTLQITCFVFLCRDTTHVHLFSIMFQEVSVIQVIYESYAISHSYPCVPTCLVNSHISWLNHHVDGWLRLFTPLCWWWNHNCPIDFPWKILTGTSCLGRQTWGA